MSTVWRLLGRIILAWWRWRYRRQIRQADVHHQVVRT